MSAGAWNFTELVSKVDLDFVLLEESSFTFSWWFWWIFESFLGLFGGVSLLSRETTTKEILLLGIPHRQSTIHWVTMIYWQPENVQPLATWVHFG